MHIPMWIKLYMKYIQQVEVAFGHCGHCYFDVIIWQISYYEIQFD